METGETEKSMHRTYLADKDMISAYEIPWEERALWWFKINGITDCYEKMDRSSYSGIFREILSGCMIPSCCIGFLVLGQKEKGISIYAGITDDEDLYECFRNSYQAVFPGIDLSNRILGEELFMAQEYGGMMTGIPEWERRQQESKQEELLPIDRICRGMLGSNFTLLVIAQRHPDIFVRKALEKLDKEWMQNNVRINSSRTGEGGWQQTVINVIAQNYGQELEQQRKMFREGSSSGIWNVSVFYGTATEMENNRLKSLLRSGYSRATESCMEPLRCIDLQGGLAALQRGTVVPVEKDNQRKSHPLNYVIENAPEFYQYLYQTLMSSNYLADYIVLPKQETIGYYVDNSVKFDVMMRTNIVGKKIRIGNITEAGRKETRKLSNLYSIPLDDLTRHGLVVGITGGGKTNTMKVLLSEIWRENEVPFLVIESAKREYIELRQIMPLGGAKNEFENLDVYTLGNETLQGVPYRLNPFEVMEGIPLQTHIDYLLATFNAAFEMTAPLPYVLERAVYEVYEDKGWNLFSGTNSRGLKDYPTLSQLYYKVDSITDRLGYDQEVQSNVKAALKARIHSLRIGGKGAMLDTAKSIPISELLGQPVVFELEDIGDDDIKAFVIGILLVQLYEYRKAMGGSHQLLGVLVVEEAHRLLKNVPSGEGNNSRAKAVEFFCNMLAEIRSYGQGILIADQVPTKLASDTIKNTNLKLVHCTVMEDDRKCIGAAMNMTQEQIDYLSSLRRGCAAVYAEGDNRPKLVAMPLVRTQEEQPRNAQIAKIRQNVLRKFQGYYERLEKVHIGCSYCEQGSCPTKELLQKMQGFPADLLWKDGIKALEILEKEYLGSRLSKQQKLCLSGYLLNCSDFSKERQAEILVSLIKQLYPE